MNLNPVELIRKKRDGSKLSESEMQYLITAYTNGMIYDYQMSAFLMAVYFKGMDFEETTHLMQAMMHSGKTLDLSDICSPKIDKHSTGGVGDKISLVLAPLLASCGVCVPMISGRGLGQTGGTLDKLESIPGLRTDLSMREFKGQLKEIGVAMIGQTAEIAPADKKMYALRDVTATVDSIPLIAASIMSKKLAEDLDGLVLDVKFGTGAFMTDRKRAQQLAHTMIQIGKRSAVHTIALLTNMDDPLGMHVGNSLEVIEAIEALKGHGPDDVMEITYALAEQMLKIAKIQGGRNLLEQKILDGSALDRFRAMIKCQGGEWRVVDDYKHLPVSSKLVTIQAPKTGYIHAIDTFKLGMLLVELGGGRSKKEDKIDPSCGFRFHRKTGDYVRKGTCLVEVFCDHTEKIQSVARKLEHIFDIKKKARPHNKLIYRTLK